MQFCHKVFKSSAVMLMLSGVCVSGNVAAGNGTVHFRADINTVEVLNDSAKCRTLGLAGAGGGGTGTSDLFVKEYNQTKNDNTITLAMSDCVEFSSDPMSLPPPEFMTFTNGEFTMTGASGEKITAVYSGKLRLVGGDVMGLRYEFIQGSTTFQITGGTGRYKRATGSGIISGSETLNPPESKGVLSAVGSIVY